MRPLLLFGLVAAVRGAANSGNTVERAVTNSSGYWYENIKHNGGNPYISNGTSWTVFRNVKSFGAKGDGRTDDTAAIQRAIDTGDNSTSRASGRRLGATGQPAVVYFPAGTYLVSDTIRNYVGTVLMGDPTNRPTLKASPDFKNVTILNGVDPRYPGLGGFYYEVKNLVFDSTAVPQNRTFSLVQWGLSQACQLSNSVFNMPFGAKNHVGIDALAPASPLMLNDLHFSGGGYGYIGSSTQYHFKNIFFNGTLTAIKAMGNVQFTAQGIRFVDVVTGIDTTNFTLGLLNLIDSTAHNTSVVVAADPQQTSAQGSLVLENVIVDATVAATVRAGNTTLYRGSIRPSAAWIRGNVYTGNSGPATPQKSPGDLILTTRPAALVNSTGFYHTVSPPTYAEFDVSQVVNIKDDANHKVVGDGVTDDTANLQAVLTAAARDGKVAYFPHGIYNITDTLYIPPGSRLFGESFTELRGSGNRFKDAKNPKAVIQVGKPGEVGVAQFTDFIFTVADILPGAILLEINMAGEKPGDVGLFFSHVRIGGARRTATNTCNDLQSCKALHIAAHLTKTSTPYIENFWAWTADHDLDNEGFKEYPTPAGGLLIESQGGAWMYGVGVEHFVLYQVTINNAKNVVFGLQQGESAYYQGAGATVMAPSPWDGELLPSDPDFSWCAKDDALCRMSIYSRVMNSEDINLYSGGFWNFVSGPNRTFCATDCQDYAAFYANNTRLFSFGVSTINDKNLIVERAPTANQSAVAVTHAANAGTANGLLVPAIMAGYFRQSGINEMIGRDAQK